LDQVFTEQQLVKLNRTFINANKEKLLGNYQQALNLFYNCVEIDPSHHPSYYEVAKIMARAGKTEDGLKNIKRAIYLHPENIWYQLLHAEILESKYDFKGAAKIFGELAFDISVCIHYLWCPHSRRFFAISLLGDFFL